MSTRILRFQIRLHSGQVEQLNVEAERVLIGSAAHCEIRLPIDQARGEHVLIELGPAGVFAKALSFEPPPTINNIPFQQAPLAAGAVLGVGGCQIYVELTEEAAAGGAKKSQQKKSSPVMLMAMVIALPLLGYFAFFEEEDNQGPAPAPRQIPELWEKADKPPTCPQTDREQALAFSREQIVLADAKRERRPFHVQDGVQAVPIYETVAACFRFGGDPASANLADESAKFLRRDITDDFRTRRVRLEHALSVEDYVSAQKEVRILLQFTEGKTGEYVQWLSNLDHTLKLKFGEKSS